jgi:hypothetical protein
LFCSLSEFLRQFPVIMEIITHIGSQPFGQKMRAYGEHF